jgi:hypothetical protein
VRTRFEPKLTRPARRTHARRTQGSRQRPRQGRQTGATSARREADAGHTRYTSGHAVASSSLGERLAERLLNLLQRPFHDADRDP